jgi:hypothetical protein
VTAAARTRTARTADRHRPADARRGDPRHGPGPLPVRDRGRCPLAPGVPTTRPDPCRTMGGPHAGVRAWVSAPGGPRRRRGRCGSRPGRPGTVAVAGDDPVPDRVGPIVGTSAIAAPPNPPPVIRAAVAPASTASSTRWSSCGIETSKSSRRLAWLAANSRPTASRSPGPQRVDGLADPGVLRHDVAQPARGDVVEAGQQPVELAGATSAGRRPARTGSASPSSSVRRA